MLEITFQYFEEHFNEIMDRIENEGAGYFIILPDGNRLIISPQKNHVIDKMEREGLIEKFK